MKRQGFTLVEVLIAVLLFLVGIFAVLSSITFSLSSVLSSREALKGDMEVSNNVEDDFMMLILQPDDFASSNKGVRKGSFSVSLSPASGDSDTAPNPAVTASGGIYLYKADNKKKTSFYLLKRE